MRVGNLFAPIVTVACDQCRFGDEQAGCHGACDQLAWVICMRAGCLGACRQVVRLDELEFAGDMVTMIVGFACGMGDVNVIAR